MIETLREGRYVCRGTLGEGSQGTTFDGIDKRSGRAVAIKRFQVRGAKSWKDVELAEREARVLSSLAHPSLPAYVDHFEENGALYLVMERIEGESLSALRRRGAVLGEDDIVRLLRDAGDVLAYLHGRAPPVIHRDLKPGNVIRRPDGSYAFVDFGAVRDKLRPEGGSTVVGTFGYMAPEQFQGRASPGSDVYSIGATALAMLTGEEPETLPHKGLAIDVESALRGHASRPLADALAQMLEPNPDVRPASLAPLLQRLDGRTPRVQERKGKRAARAERKAARMRARADRRSRRRAELPRALLIFASIGLTLATIAVVLSLRVVVPTVLTLLSLFFGRKLRAAGARVSEAGRRAGEAMERARAFVHRRPQAEAAVRIEEVEREDARRPPANATEERAAPDPLGGETEPSRMRVGSVSGDARRPPSLAPSASVDEEEAAAYEREARRGR